MQEIYSTKQEHTFHYYFLGHVIRSSGATLRQDLSSNVTLEDVEKKWETVTDMSSAKHYNSIEVYKWFKI